MRHTVIDAHVHVFEVIAGMGARGELRAVGGGRARWATGEEFRMLPDGCGDFIFATELLPGQFAQRAD